MVLADSSNARLAVVAQRILSHIVQSPVALGVDDAYESVGEVMHSMACVHEASPLRMWLLGQFIVLRHRAMCSVGVASRPMSPADDVRLTRCFARLVRVESQARAFLARLGGSGAIELAMRCRADEIPAMVIEAPAEDLAFFLHGVYMARTAVLEPLVVH